MAQPARRPIFEHPGRVAIVTITLAVVASLGALLLDTADTDPDRGRPELPAAIERIGPERGELTGLVDTVEVDLDDRYTGDLVVDGITIPEDQLERIEELGVVAFRPGPGKEIERFRAGENTVVVAYWLRSEARPADPPTFSWRFRAAA